jgi:hypothetical protein
MDIHRASGAVMKYIAAVALVAMGMYGRHMNIEYYGWVLAAGLLAAAS